LRVNGETRHKDYGLSKGPAFSHQNKNLSLVTFYEFLTAKGLKAYSKDQFTSMVAWVCK
jgi:hypothetical protein